MLRILRHLFGVSTRRVPVAVSQSRRAVLELESLGERLLLSATPLRLAVMGDSLSAPYAGQPYGVMGDRSWVEQLQTLRSSKIVISEEAFAGATSNSLLHSESGHTAQARAVVDLVTHHAVDDVVLMIGANDVAQDLPILSVNPAQFVSTFVNTVVTNVETAVATVAAAGQVGFVLGTVPDVTVTPAFRAGVPAAAMPVVEEALTLANQQIEAFATARDIPVVDLYGLTHLSLHPPTLGGVQISNLYAPDYFHPNTVGQGILADTVLEALHKGDDVNTHRLRLSDQDILTEANIAHTPGRTYFDVTPFVIANEDRHDHGCAYASVFQGLDSFPDDRHRYAIVSRDFG